MTFHLTSLAPGEYTKGTTLFCKSDDEDEYAAKTL